MANENLQSVFSTLDSILKKTDLTDVTSESAGFSELPEGYYLCEVTKSEMKSTKESKQPMAAFQLKVVDDGLKFVEENDEINEVTLKGTKGRTLFLNYVLKDESSVRRFVADMLKFEGETPGESLLPKEAFTTSETVEDAIACLVGMRIYTQISKTERDDGTTATWTNLVSWKRATKLELPM